MRSKISSVRACTVIARDVVGGFGQPIDRARSDAATRKLERQHRAGGAAADDQNRYLFHLYAPFLRRARVSQFLQPERNARSTFFGSARVSKNSLMYDVALAALRLSSAESSRTTPADCGLRRRTSRTAARGPPGFHKAAAVEPLTDRLIFSRSFGSA